MSEGPFWTRRLALTLAACALGLAACGGEDDAPDAASDGGEKKVVIGHVSPALSNPTLVALNRGQQQAAAELGWEVKTADANLSPDRQVSGVDTMVNQRVDALTTWVLDPGPMTAALQRTHDAEIPVVTFNSPPSEHVATNIETELSSSCKPFEYQAKFIAERISGASVLVIGPPPVPALLARVDCFTEAAKAAGLKILERQDNTQDSAGRSQAIVQDLLTKHRKVDAVWGYNDPTAIGASAAAVGAGQKIWSGDQQGVIVIGNNGDVNAVEAVRNGSLTLTFDENAFEAGVAAIKALRPVLADGEPVAAMPKTVTIPSDPIDASNVEDWVAPDQRKPEL